MKKVFFILVFIPVYFISSCSKQKNSNLEPSGINTNKKDISKNFRKEGFIDDKMVGGVYQLSELFHQNYSQENYEHSIKQLNSFLDEDIEPDFSKFNEVNLSIDKKLREDRQNFLKDVDQKYVILASKLSECFKPEYTLVSELEESLSKAINILHFSNTSKEYKIIVELQLRKLVNDGKFSLGNEKAKKAKISADSKCKFKNYPCIIFHITTGSGVVLSYYLLFNTPALQALINSYSWDYIIHCCFCNCECPSGCPSLIGAV